MEENMIKDRNEEIVDDFFYALKTNSKVKHISEMKSEDFEIDGQKYIFFINYEINELPYFTQYSEDYYNPAYDVQHGETAFEIYGITGSPMDEEIMYDVLSMLTPEEYEDAKGYFDFEYSELPCDVNESKVTKRNTILISESDILKMVKRAINEVASKKTAINRIYRVTHEITGRIYHDDNWEGVTLVYKAIQSLGYDVGMGAKDGGYRRNNDGTQWKEYQVDIDTPEGFNIQGILNCHAAGSMEDPFDRYDMSLILW